MIVVAIDPGSERSAVVRCEVPVTLHTAPPWGIQPLEGEHLPNDAVLPQIRDVVLVIETMATLYKSNAAAALLATERWAGRFIERFCTGPIAVSRVIEVTSSAARVAVCGTTKVGDADVRRGLVDAYGGDLRAFGRRCPACKGKGWRGRDHGACPDCGEDPGWNPPRGPLHGWMGTHPFRALACAWAAYIPGGPGRVKEER